jgi:hypothetical protein
MVTERIYTDILTIQLKIKKALKPYFSMLLDIVKTYKKMRVNPKIPNLMTAFKSYMKTLLDTKLYNILLAS